MVAYAIVDVEVYDIETFLLYQKSIAPLLRAAGAKYLARGGQYRVYEGDYSPDSLMVLQFPSLEVMDTFFESEAYQALAAQRQGCCAARIVAVEGLDTPVVRQG